MGLRDNFARRDRLFSKKARENRKKSIEIPKIIKSSSSSSLPLGDNKNNKKVIQRPGVIISSVKEELLISSTTTTPIPSHSDSYGLDNELLL